MTFGDKLKKLRQNRGIKQSEIAAILDCTPSSLANWEKGKIQPSMDVLARLCEILKISPLALLSKEYNYKDIVGITSKPVYKRMYEEHVALTFSYEILSKLSLSTETVHVTCEFCKYAHPDQAASEWKWTAYKCINKASVYYGSLLNVTYSGKKLNWICWAGCDQGQFGEMVKPAYTPNVRLATLST